MPNDIDELPNAHPQDLGSFAMGTAGSGVVHDVYGTGIELKALQPQHQRGQGTVVRIELEHTVSVSTATGSAATPAEYLNAFLDYKIGFPAAGQWEPVDVKGEEVLEREQDRFHTAQLTLRGAAPVADIAANSSGSPVATSNIIFHSFIDFHDPDINLEWGTAFPNVIMALGRLYLKWATAAKTFHVNNSGGSSVVTLTAASTRVVAWTVDDTMGILKLPIEIERGYKTGLQYPYLNPGAGDYLSIWLRRGMFETDHPEDLTPVTLVRFGVQNKYVLFDVDPRVHLRAWARKYIRESVPVSKTQARDYGYRLFDPENNFEATTPAVQGRRRIIPLISSYVKRDHITGAINFSAGPTLTLNGGKASDMPFTTVDFGYRRMVGRVQPHIDFMMRALKDGGVNVTKGPYVPKGYTSKPEYAPLIVEYAA